MSYKLTQVFSEILTHNKQQFQFENEIYIAQYITKHLYCAEYTNMSRKVQS